MILNYLLVATTFYFFGGLVQHGIEHNDNQTWLGLIETIMLILFIGVLGAITYRQFGG